MKANELMIGDRVLLDGIPKRLTLWDIVEISRGIYCAEPIPLTGEILKENGFRYFKSIGETHPYYYIQHKFSMKCAQNGDGHFYLDCIGADVKIYYVHQLQHALRLCGLNDIADNFKI